MSWLADIDKIMDRLEPSEREFNEMFDSSEPFLVKAMQEIARASVPSVNLEIGGGFNARRMGGVVGHKLGYWQTLAGVATNLPQKNNNFLLRCNLKIHSIPKRELG